MRPHRQYEKHDRVATYLFAEMCSHSEAGHDNAEIYGWYSDALEFYETVLETETGVAA